MPTLPRQFAILAALLLAGCGSLGPEEVSCPGLKVLEGAERVSITGADLGDRIDFRVREVATRCTAGPNGPEMEVALGLILNRETSQPRQAERVPFDVTFAFLDGGDEVVSRHVFSDAVHMAAFRLSTRPVVNIKFTVPPSTRVVFGLGRAE